MDDRKYNRIQIEQNVYHIISHFALYAANCYRFSWLKAQSCKFEHPSAENYPILIFSVKLHYINGACFQ